MDWADEHWWTGRLNGAVGTLPSNYVAAEASPERPEETYRTSGRFDSAARFAAAPVAHAPEGGRAVVVALYDCAADDAAELSFRAGDFIDVDDDSDQNWWRGHLPSGEAGIFPANYVRPAG